MTTMAKGTQTANRKTDTKSPSRAVATKNEQVPAELLKMMQEDAGKGLSTDASDNIVPLVYVLQSNSPALDRANAQMYLGKQAKAGDIWLRGTKTFFPADSEDDNEEGMLVVPCHFSKCWIEWRPDRGGFVARHAKRPAAAVLKSEKREGSDRMRDVWRMPGGNSVQETREYVVLVLNHPSGRPMPFVIPMTSTQHTAARMWMSLMNEKTLPGDASKSAPLFSHVYRMKTVAQSNDDGNWYGWQITDAGEEDGASVPELLQDLAIYREAKRINEQFNAGTMRADVGDEDEAASGAGNDDDDM